MGRDMSSDATGVMKTNEEELDKNQPTSQGKEKRRARSSSKSSSRTPTSSVKVKKSSSTHQRSTDKRPFNKKSSSKKLINSRRAERRAQRKDDDDAGSSSSISISSTESENEKTPDLTNASSSVEAQAKSPKQSRKVISLAAMAAMNASPGTLSGSAEINTASKGRKIRYLATSKPRKPIMTRSGSGNMTRTGSGGSLNRTGSGGSLNARSEHSTSSTGGGSQQNAAWQVTTGTGSTTCISTWEMRRRFQTEFPNEPVPSDTVLRQLYRGEKVASYERMERFKLENPGEPVPSDDVLKKLYMAQPGEQVSSSTSMNSPAPVENSRSEQPSKQGRYRRRKSSSDLDILGVQGEEEKVNGSSHHGDKSSWQSPRLNRSMDLSSLSREKDQVDVLEHSEGSLPSFHAFEEHPKSTNWASAQVQSDPDDAVKAFNDSFGTLGKNKEKLTRERRPREKSERKSRRTADVEKSGHVRSKAREGSGRKPQRSISRDKSLQQTQKENQASADTEDGGLPRRRESRKSKSEHVPRTREQRRRGSNHALKSYHGKETFSLDEKPDEVGPPNDDFSFDAFKETEPKRGVSRAKSDVGLPMHANAFGVFDAGDKFFSQSSKPSNRVDLIMTPEDVEPKTPTLLPSRRERRRARSVDKLKEVVAFEVETPEESALLRKLKGGGNAAPASTHNSKAGMNRSRSFGNSWMAEVPGAFRKPQDEEEVELEVGASEPMSPLTVATKKAPRPVITRRRGLN